MPTPHPITLALDRTLLEHPEAVHLRRMRMALWLYLALLGRLPAGSDAVQVDPKEFAGAMGLPEGTVLSWLGHLRKARYIAVSRTGGTIHVTVKRVARSPAPKVDPAPRIFTVPKLARALGERGNDEALAGAIADYPDPLIQRALAGALAVPAAEIRRSRTALFLFLLKRYAPKT